MPTELQDDQGTHLRVRVSGRAVRGRAGARPRSLHAVGTSALVGGEFDRAAALLQQGLGLDPKSPALMRALGDAMVGLGRRPQAMICYRRALVMDPLDLRARMALGEQQLAAGSFTEAAASFSAVLGSLPADAGARVRMGQALEGAGRVDAAVKTYKVALRLAPSLAGASAGLGRCLLRQGKVALAERVFSRALRRDHQQPEVLEALAWLLLQTDRPQSARQRFKEALSIQGDTASLLAGLSLSLRAVGARRQAHLVLSRVAEDDAPVLVWARGRLALDGGRLGAATEAVRGALAGALPHPLRVELLHLHGDLLDAQGHAEAALAAWQAGRLAGARRWDGAAVRRRNDALTRFFDAPAVHLLSTQQASTARPVFVVGMPGAGLSELRPLLSAHPALHVVSDRPELSELAGRLQVMLGIAYPECLSRLAWARPGQLARRYLDGVGDGALEAQRVVDLTAANLEHLGLVAALFPRARVVVLRRESEAAAVAWLRRPARTPANELGQSLEEIRAMAAEDERLLAHWQRVLPLSMSTVSHEALRRSPRETLRELGAFLGLGEVDMWVDRLVGHRIDQRRVA